MRPRTLLLLLGVTLASVSAPLLLNGCRTTPAPDPIAESAYTQWRWIGRMQKNVSNCPDIPGWEEGPLFPDLRRQDADRGQHRAVLDRYCLYTTENAGLRFPTKLPAGLAAAAPDRMAVSTTSAGGHPVGPLGQAAWPVWARQFRIQTLGTNDEKESVILLKESPPSVRLVFLDTQATGQPFVPLSGSRHGYTLVHLARNLICPSGGQSLCAARIETRSALLYDGFDPNRPLPPASPGGHLGLLSHLAAAIETEVSNWLTEEGRPRHLILNLSLGWDGEPFGDLKAKKTLDLAPPVKAVYDALRYAEDNGVLVIAAAGNRRGGPDSTAPLLPAAWDLKRPEESSRKLIHAVGGVDARGLHLANSRRQGRPQCAAFADHAVAQGSDGLPTAIYTGTSVSAAVVSSIAAVIWHLRPELVPVELMQLITRAGNVTDSVADYYPEALTKAPRVHRLSLCPAVKQACADAPCSALEAIPACVWDPTPAKTPTSSLPPSGARRAGLSPPCGPNNPCPTEQFPDQTSHRWVGPQPEETPCSNCVLRPPPPGTSSSFSYALYPELDPAWLPSGDPGFESSVLQLVCGSNPVITKSYTIPVDLLGQSEPITLDPIASGDLANCSATLDFKMEGQRLSVQSPIYVIP